MTTSDKSSVITNSRPAHVFYVWYSELCRRVNANPLSIVKPAKPKHHSVLDFVADRIKPEEWSPILNALRLDTSLHVIAIRSRVIGFKFLEDMNTEDKVRRMKRRCGSLWTAYISKSLIKSLCCCITKSQVLTSLELDGLPLSVEYMEELLQALKKNKLIRFLSFAHSSIKDGGCKILCSALRDMPNIEVLNMSACNLTSLSGELIANLIKFQQLHRYCVSWHNSLRYEEPDVGSMAGLKRILLNNNPNIGNEGLICILEGLVDDLWIKALDMQRCGITENISDRLLDVLDYNRSLDIADFRNNQELSSLTQDRIFTTLKKKFRIDHEAEYQWCLTATTLCNTSHLSAATTSNRTDLQKCKSAFSQQSLPGTQRQFPNIPVRRIQTSSVLPRKPTPVPKTPPSAVSSLTRRSVFDLNTKLQEERKKRMQLEKLNNVLQKKLQEISDLSELVENHPKSETHNTILDVMHVFNDLQAKDEKQPIKNVGDTLKKQTVGATKKKEQPHCQRKLYNPLPSGSLKKNVLPSKPETSTDGVHARDMFEQYFFKDTNDVELSDNEDIEEIALRYYYNTDVSLHSDSDDRNKDDRTMVSGSTASLIKFMEDLKCENEDLHIDIAYGSSSSESSARTIIPNTRSTRRVAANAFQKPFVAVR